jgi:hypothetical protein
LLSAKKFTGLAEKQAEEYSEKILNRFSGESVSEDAYITV